MKRRYIIVITAAALVCALYARTLFEAWSKLNAAERAEHFAAQHEQLADALSWGGSFNPFADRARENLERELADGSLPTERRLSALAALRRGLASSRSFLSPHREALAALEVRERELLTAEAPALKLLRPPRIQYGYQALSQVGFWGWIASVLWLIFSAFAADGRVNLTRLPLPLAASASSFALWLFALWKA
jgi:hypothetical protein